MGKQTIIFFIIWLSAFSVKAQEKQNALLIILDDMNDYIGVMGGHPQAITPNIDHLAAEGVFFFNAHSNAPICAPSRASFLSGLYPSTTGNFGFGHIADNPVLSNSKFIMEYAAENGFETYSTGKVFHRNVDDKSNIKGRARQQNFYQKLAAGEITKLGTIEDDAYEEMRKRAKNMVKNDKYPKFSKYTSTEYQRMFLLTENLDRLKEKDAQYYFFVGTNDNITMDVPLLAENYPDYPITYYPGGMHGGMSRFRGISGTPDKEEAKTNRIAFFSQFYLGQNTILEKPDVEYNYAPADRTIAVTVTFKPDNPNEVALHYAYDRFSAGSKGYEYDAWEKQSMKQKDKHTGQLEIKVPKHVKTVSMLSFQEQDKEGMTSNSSSNYITVKIK